MNTNKSQKIISNENEEQEQEVEDYMSNEFLAQIPDTRPGLVFNKSTARKYEIDKKHESINKKNKQVSLKELEEAKREEGLKTSSLKSDNKGYNLMLKMGYKHGQCLGKAETKLEPANKKKLLEPISVEIKTDREGLGITSERKKRLEEIEILTQKLKENKLKNDLNAEKMYLDLKRSKFNLRKLVYSLHKCQKICYQLDSTRQNLKEPEIIWYWPKVILKELKLCPSKEIKPELELELNKIESEETENIYSETELRMQAEQIESKDNIKKIDLNQVYQERLESFLKEETKTEIKQEQTNLEEEEEEDEDEEEYSSNYYCDKVKLEKEKNLEEEMSDYEDEIHDENNEELITKKIDSICLYLREKYLYCVWCATSYENENEMIQNCPGLTEKDHEND